jgi:hypothetical protein
MRSAFLRAALFFSSRYCCFGLSFFVSFHAIFPIFDSILQALPFSQASRHLPGESSSSFCLRVLVSYLPLIDCCWRRLLGRVKASGRDEGSEGGHRL